jgi:hypothetical protein
MPADCQADANDLERTSHCSSSGAKINNLQLCRSAVFLPCRLPDLTCGVGIEGGNT